MEATLQILRAGLKTNSASFAGLVAAALLSFAGPAGLPGPAGAGSFHISLHIGQAYPHQSSRTAKFPDLAMARRFNSGRALMS